MQEMGNKDSQEPMVLFVASSVQQQAMVSENGDQMTTLKQKFCSKDSCFVWKRDLKVNPIQARGVLLTPLRFFIHNAQSFWVNSLKFGDFS